jgi:hypothetical protein
MTTRPTVAAGLASFAANHKPRNPRKGRSEPMRFSHKLAKRIQEGRKIETRRPAKWIKVDKDAEPKLSARTRRSPRSHQKVVYVDQGYAGQKVLAPCRYRVDHDYALQVPPDEGSRARAKTIDGRLFVKSVHLEELGAIDQEGAVAEGFASPHHFRAYWTELYGELDPHQLVWVIRFKLVRDPEQYRDADRLLAMEGKGEHGVTHLHSAAVRDPETNIPEVRPPGRWEKDNSGVKSRDFHLQRLGRFERTLTDLEQAAGLFRRILAERDIDPQTKSDVSAKLRGLEHQIHRARTRLLMADKHVA